MRAQILNALFDRMVSNRDLFFLTADMGINLVERFAEAYPDRFLNVGIAEQNLIGIASGLSNIGYRPFAYTISNFLIIRALEQIRNDIAIHNYPVTLLGIGTGYDNSPLAPTHHVLDDWGMVRALGRFEIYCPSNVHHAAGLVDRVLAGRNPVYIRIPKATANQPNSDQDYVYLPGTRKILLISYGNIAHECLRLREQRPDISVLICNRLHPLARDPLEEALASHRHVVVAEDHFASTGMFSSVCQFAASYKLNPDLHSLAPLDYRLDVGKNPAYYHQVLGIDADGLQRKIAELL